MQAGDVKLGKVFANAHVNVIPLFQRPYVWDQAENWDPLWKDIQRAAEDVESEPAGGPTNPNPTTYFLGAVVIQQRPKHPKRLHSSHIIDGQQRMTTLQVLLAAARSVATARDEHKTAARFSALIENQEAVIDDDFPNDRYKVWPLPQDRDAFLWAVRRPDDATAAADPSHRLVRARSWFEQTISAWINLTDDPPARLEHLLHALEDRVQLVEITLDAADHPQVIFEALNHRGVRLAAADLVKNHLFHRVETQGDGDQAESLLLEHWLPLDDKYWRDQVTTGRIKRALVDLLLTYWLTIKKGEEVLVEQLFTDFKKWATEADANAATVIKDLRHHANVYAQLDKLPRTDPTGRLLDSMRSTGTSTPWPVLLYLHANPGVPPEQRARAAEAIESFLMRRGVAGLTSADYNRLFVVVLKEAIESPPSRSGDAVVACLATQTADSRAWPTDDEFREALLAPGLYDRMYRARLKALLVGLENHLCSDKVVGGGNLDPGSKKLNIEHVLPQSWTANWPLAADASELALLRRTNSIHQLGNLTLATTKLNPKLSNKAWLKKRELLMSHSLVRLTTASILSTPHPEGAAWSDGSWTSDWDEARIEARGKWLARHALELWTRPTAVESSTDLLEAAPQAIDDEASDEN